MPGPWGVGYRINGPCLPVPGELQGPIDGRLAAKFSNRWIQSVQSPPEPDGIRLRPHGV